MFWKNTKKMKKLLKKHVDKEYSLFKKSVLNRLGLRGKE